MADQLGPLVRLWGLSTAELPPPTASADDLAPFLISILQEAVPFIDSAAPKNHGPDNDAATSNLWKSKGVKSFPDSAGKVELSERVVPVAELEMIAARNALPHGRERGIPAETWACRRSVHEDAAGRGTASWEEFRRCFKEAHAEAEARYTPGVIQERAAATWRCDGVEADEGGERWGEFTLRIQEMLHKLGAPLKNRVFPVLEMTASAVGGQEFLVVQVAVPDFGEQSPESRLARDKGVVVARYSSVERVRKLPGTGDIEWLMATASDAGGLVPLWIQAKAVTGIIGKDVPLFMAWIAKERRRKDKDTGRKAERETGTGTRNSEESPGAEIPPQAPPKDDGAVDPDLIEGVGVAR